jgi:GNAT superfamily N-acetyltransferase
MKLSASVERNWPITSLGRIIAALVRITPMKLNFELLDTFVEENSRRQGARARLTFGPLMVWFRIAGRMMDGVPGLTIDIADVEVEEGERRKGAFRSLLSHIEPLAKKHGIAVYVQSITNDHVITELQRRGYQFSIDGIGSDAWLSPTLIKSHELDKSDSPSP